HVRSAHWQPAEVGQGDRAHCHELGTCTLSVRKVALADFLTDRFDDALPTDRRAEPKRERDRQKYPRRSVLGDRAQSGNIAPKRDASRSAQLENSVLMKPRELSADKENIGSETPTGLGGEG